MSIRRSGFTMVEVITVMAILSVVVVGVSAMMVNFHRATVRDRVSFQLDRIRQAVKDRIEDDKSWHVTIQKEANLQCLRYQTDCSGVAGWFNIAAYRVAQETAALAIAIRPGERFTLQGVSCGDPAGYVTAVDNDTACPISVNIRGNYNCAAAPCYPASVEVTYAPHIAADFEREYGGFATNVDGNGRPSGCKYCLNMNRGMASIEQSISVSEALTNPATPGTCTVGGLALNWVKRNLNTIETDSEDLKGSAMASVAAGVVTMPAGRYKCKAQAPGQAVGTFRLRARVTNPADASVFGAEATAYAGRRLSNVPDQTIAVLEFEVRSTTTNAINLVIEQFCERTFDALDLGTPVGPAGTITRYARLECRRAY